MIDECVDRNKLDSKDLRQVTDNNNGKTTMDNNENYQQNDFLSKCGQIFHQKLINHIEPASIKRNKYSASIDSSQLADEDGTYIIDKVLMSNPFDIVRFTPYSKNTYQTKLHKNRVFRVHIGRIEYLKAHLNIILCHKYTEIAFLTLLALDSIIVGISIDLDAKKKNDYIDGIEIFQLIVSGIFILEILMKLFVDTNEFFNSPWNKFDAFLIVFTTILEIIDYIYRFDKKPDNNGKSGYRIMMQLRVFRVFRLLKVISHFIQLRIIIIALTKAVKSVVLISTLLFIFAYMFASIGTIIFSDLENRIDDDEVNDCFSDIHEALLTLFAVMTLDQWWKIFSAASESNEDDFLSSVYFISWVILAGFIFQNLFTGVMVNNFQQIRQQVETGLNLKVIKQVKVKSEKLVQALQDIQIMQDTYLIDKENDETNKTAEARKQESFKSLNLSNQSESEKQSQLSLNTYNQDSIDNYNTKALRSLMKKLEKNRTINKTWLIIIESMDKVFKCISTSNQRNIWPEDTLLYYYELMQSLMDNLKETMILLDYANQCLLNMHDRDNLLLPKSNYKSATKKKNE